MTDTWNQHGWMVEKRNAYIIHPNQGTMMMDKGLSALLLTSVEPEDKLSTTWASVKQQY